MGDNPRGQLMGKSPSWNRSHDVIYAPLRRTSRLAEQPLNSIDKTSRPRGHRPLSSAIRSIVVQDRADAAVLGEQRVAAVAEQVQIEGLVGLLRVVTLDFDRDRLRRLAGGE